MKEPLVAAASFTFTQFVNEGVPPTALELCQVVIYQNRALSSFLFGTPGVPAGFGCHARQALQLSVGVTPEVSSPSSSVLDVESIPVAVQRGIGGLPRLVVDIPHANPRNIIMRVGVVGKSRAF